MASIHLHKNLFAFSKVNCTLLYIGITVQVPRNNRDETSDTTEDESSNNAGQQKIS